MSRMKQANYRYLFGPVPSRRFGRSLGIDLTPHKTCCFDCVFCQLGRTPTKTVERKEYVPTEAVLRELDRWFRSGGEADYVTLSGGGEPTLHARFGEVLEFIRSRGTIPSVLLTNGALLHLPEVRAAAGLADIVKISMSVWDQTSFEWINRPHPQLFFNQMIEGQKRFRSRFGGQVWMEVFLVRGMNSSPEEVTKVATLAREIAPDRIQLNTAVRPPAEAFVTALPKEQMAALMNLFQPTAEIIADFSAPRSKPMQTNTAAILAMLKRRPCTAQQIAEGFGLHVNEVSKYLGSLMQEKKIRVTRRKDGVYYRGCRHRYAVVEHSTATLPDEGEYCR
jgi:wyosine [tRNA(Phe)-imidazoG37] synthetase (radical SAM superfamily)